MLALNAPATTMAAVHSPAPAAFVAHVGNASEPDLAQGKPSKLKPPKQAHNYLGKLVTFQLMVSRCLCVLAYPGSQKRSNVVL